MVKVSFLSGILITLTSIFPNHQHIIFLQLPASHPSRHYPLQFIEQPQQMLDHARMRSDLVCGVEGFDGLLDFCTGGLRSAATGQPTQSQPPRIQCIVIIGRLGNDLFLLGDGASEGLVRGAPIFLPQDEDTVQGGCIVIILWHIILKSGFDGGAGMLAKSTKDTK